jgi:hypothetical protein
MAYLIGGAIGVFLALEGVTLPWFIAMFVFGLLGLILLEILL